MTTKMYDVNPIPIIKKTNCFTILPIEISFFFRSFNVIPNSTSAVTKGSVMAAVYKDELSIM